ncbi:uncharacterized protein LOC128270138 [Anopheles cruzii]|uniref:uncharacterized protein LOC128270138 n=1 Tax=Anopheles cruzii TaxID=68878 RepID=UPI0022EC5D0F|nr:uncharacterized protein LOC128270138 [Anopheles cruzii]
MRYSPLVAVVVTVFSAEATVLAGLDSVDLEVNGTASAAAPLNDVWKGTEREKVLSRRKRFVVFPEGSSISVAVCMTIGIYGNPNYQMVSWALNWGIAYNLPNQTISFVQEMAEPKPMVQRRNRRDLYQKLEVIMNNMGYDGRDCILRALCESSQYFGRKGNNMIAEMLRTLFSYPKSKVLSHEHSDHKLYDEAHQTLHRRPMPHLLLLQDLHKHAYKNLAVVVTVFSAEATVLAGLDSVDLEVNGTASAAAPLNDVWKGTEREKVLSRRKRFVVFPEGSSISVAVCMTIGIYGNPNYQMVSWALNWGIAYNLPNQTISFVQEMAEPKPMVQRRNRRDLYQKLEVIMNNMGYDGRDCILRALCESSQYFGRKGNNMIAEMLRTLFSYPKSKVLSHEHSDHKLYDEAHRKGKNMGACQSLYANCRFSLLELALGKYSTPYGFM